VGLLLRVLPRARRELRYRTIATSDASARGREAHEVLGMWVAENRRATGAVPLRRRGHAATAAREANYLDACQALI